MCMSNALAKVTAEFAEHDPFSMAELSGARFSQGRFYFNYCSLPLTVDYPGGDACFESAGLPLSYYEQVLLIQYLSCASGLPPHGRWLSFLDLRGGSLHWRPFQREALEPLARHYHNRLDLFLAAGMKHGGEMIKMGDAALLIPVLPRLSLVFIVWQGDNEFAPRSMILFDAAAGAYLPTDSLYVLGIQALIRIWFPGDNRFVESSP